MDTASVDPGTEGGKSGQMALSNRAAERTRLALGGVAIAALVFGVWQLRTTISLPFLLLPTSTPQAQAPDTSGVVDLSGLTLVQIQELKNKDTDKDELSDYDELYSYHTSPYLKDSDSDGVDDKTEVGRGTDPNCATGATCVGPKGAIAGTTPVGSDLLPGTSEVLTPDNIRELLKQSGLSEAEIAKYDDATLLKVYQEVTGESGATGSTTPVADQAIASLTAEQKAALSKMSGPELRQFLLAGGADKATLDKIDDDTLKAFVLDAIK